MNPQIAHRHTCGLTLIELLIYVGILGILLAVVHTTINYYQTESSKIQNEAQLAADAQVINALLQTKLAGGNAVRSAPSFSSTNGNYCYQISEARPTSFKAVTITNGARFRFADAAAPGGINAESKLGANQSLGLSNSLTAQSIARSLSIWVKLPPTAANSDRTLFSYARADSQGYKMIVKVANSNSIRVDMGMGLPEFSFGVSNIRNGEWHHIAVLAGDLTANTSAPTVYVNGVRYTASRSAVLSLTPSSVAYTINIGDSVQTGWSLGPVGLWDRLLTTTELAQLGRMESVDLRNAFWLSAPQAAQSTAQADVTNIDVVNARTQLGYLLFQKVSSSGGSDNFNIHLAETAATCPDVGPTENPKSLGFERLTQYTCATASGSAPLLIASGASGQERGFQWKCDLTLNNQMALAPLITGNTNTAIKKSEDACGLPIEPSDFATTSSAHTAYVIVDNFDPSLDLIAFRPASGPNVFPTQMTATTTNTGENITTVPSIPTGTILARWFSDAGSNVGLIRLEVREPNSSGPLAPKDKDWWVENVFRKIVYKSRTDVYVADRKIVFALGELWPIKTCPGLGYKSSYHFYKMESVPEVPNNSPRMLRAYRDAYQNRSYHGMTGYLGNLRCEAEKSQVSKQVLDVIATNVYAVIGIWATTQGNGASTSEPNFANQNGSNSREHLDGSQTKMNDTFPDSFFDGTQNAAISGSNGNTQWRLIGGPRVDHDVIILTDHTDCGRHSTDRWRGCLGTNTITVDASTNDGLRSRLSSQSGGSRQYGWWHPKEPNKSGEFVNMGYEGDLDGAAGENFWDDIEPKDARGNSKDLGRYLLEFGDHPWDAVTAPNSAYKAAHANDTASPPDSSSNLDPPNVATKSFSTVKAQYCK